MARPAEPGRTALLKAGEHVLADDGLPALSVNNVVARAGMAKGSFYQHWPARADFLRDLHTRFHDGLAAQVTKTGAAVRNGCAPCWTPSWTAVCASGVPWPSC